jgi:hypothetical protein
MGRWLNDNVIKNRTGAVDRQMCLSLLLWEIENMTTQQEMEGVRPIAGLPIDAECMFSDKKGVYRKGLETKKTKLV